MQTLSGPRLFTVGQTSYVWEEHDDEHPGETTSGHRAGDVPPRSAASAEAAAPAGGGPPPAAGPSVADPGPDGDLTLRAAEARHIRLVLDKMSGNKRRAARALGVSSSTLDRKLGR